MHKINITRPLIQDPDFNTPSHVWETNMNTGTLCIMTSKPTPNKNDNHNTPDPASPKLLYLELGDLHNIPRLEIQISLCSAEFTAVR